MHTHFEPPVPPSKRKLRDVPIDIEVIDAGHEEDISQEIESGFVVQDEQPVPVLEASRYRKIARTCLFLLIFLLPFFVLPFTASPIDQSKNLLLCVLTSIATILFFGVVIRERRFEVPTSRLSFAVLLLLGAQVISTIFSKNPSVSFWGNFAAPDTLLNFLLYCLLFFLTFFFFRKGDLKHIARWFFAGVTIVGVIGILQLLGKFILPWDFTHSISFNPTGSITSWGIMLAAIFVLIVEMPLQKYATRKKIAFIFLGAMTVFGLIVLNFQLLWVSIALLMVIIAAFHFVTHDRFGGSLALVVTALFLALTSQALPTIKPIPLEIRPGFSATASIAKAVISPRLLFGTGPGTFAYEWLMRRPVNLNTTQFWSLRFSQGFGWYITMLTTTGVVGVFALLFLIFAFLRSVMRVLNNREALIIASGICFLFISMFFFPSSLLVFSFLFFGLGLLARLEGRVRTIDIQRLSRKTAFGIFIGCVILIALAFASLYMLTQKYIAATYETSGLSALSRGDIGQAFQLLQTATQLDNTSDQYFRSASQALLTRVGQLAQINAANSSDASTRAEFQTDMANVVFAARRATELNPLDSVNWINLAQSYETLIPLASGADVFADASYRKAIELDPSNPQLQVDLARILAGMAFRGDSAIHAKKLEEAHAMIDKAIGLKSDYAPAHFFAAQLYIAEGNSEKAAAKLNETKAASPFDAGLAFQIGLIYYQMNQFGAAQEEFERAISIDANYANARYFLGLIYDRNGQKSLAMQQFKKLQELVPDNTEIERIIVNLTAGRGALQDIAPPATPPEKRSDVPVSDSKKQ